MSQMIEESVSVSKNSKNSHKVCAIASCLSPNNVIYHRFPPNPVVQKAWINACRRKDSFNKETARICQVHFSNESYERDLRNELLGLPCRKRLRKDAIPTKNLPLPAKLEEKAILMEPLQIQNESSLSSRTLRYQQRRNRQIVAEIIAQDEKKFDEVEKVDEPDKVDELDKVDASIQCDVMDFSSRVKEQLENTKLKYLKQKMMCSRLKKEVKRLKSEKYKSTLLQDCLRKKFSSSETKMILKPKKKRWVKYTQEDIVRALILRTISSRAFEFVRSIDMMPFPSTRTQERWLENFKCIPGYQTDSINVLKEMYKSSSFESKYSVLCFDEAQMKQKFEIDLKSQTVYGPFKKLQVVLARGLIEKWKQPVYFQFDTSMSKNLLFEIIIFMEKEGFQIHAVVCDMGNHQLISELGLHDSNYSFNNPYDPSRKVYIFPDGPHLLKLCRNHLLDKGFMVPAEDGTLVPLTKSNFEDILRYDSGELKIAHKLHDFHINIKGNARQRVRIAAQLLSWTTGKAMTFLCHSKEALARQNAIHTINNWFDCINSRQIHDPAKLRCAFGIHMEEQLQALDKMENFLNKFKVIGARSVQPWQKGIRASISSTRGLFNDLVVNGPLKFLLMSRVNQDCLENFFSRLRGIGGDNKHPGGLEAMRRMRILQIGKNANVLVSNPAVAMEKDIEIKTNVFCGNNVESAKDIIQNENQSNTTNKIPNGNLNRSKKSSGSSYVMDITKIVSPEMREEEEEEQLCVTQKVTKDIDDLSLGCADSQEIEFTVNFDEDHN